MYVQTILEKFTVGLTYVGVGRCNKAAKQSRKQQRSSVSETAVSVLVISFVSCAVVTPFWNESDSCKITIFTRAGTITANSW
jgi:hypothetical protein